VTTTVTDAMEAKAKDARRERLHRLVDDMHEGELATVETFVDFVRERGDPLLRKLMNAPYDDEPVTPEEEEAVREALEDVAAGRVQTLDEVMKELGH
jgi:hypothetical protein